MREKQTCLHEEWGQMSTSQLDDILQAELQKECPDENTVLPILRILEAREYGEPAVLTESARAAWAKFEKTTAERKQRGTALKWITSTAATIAIICAVLLAIPLDAEAGTLFERLVYLTDRVLQFFDPDGDPGDLQREYIFETDNPGLQQLHDKMVELGVTEPVVPMWLPEGYDVEGIESVPMPGYTKVYAKFLNGAKTIVVQYILSSTEGVVQYEVKNKQVSVYELFGTYHTIIENEKDLSAVWEKAGVECLIVADLGGDEMHTILKSIYGRNTK